MSFASTMCIKSKVLGFAGCEHKGILNVSSLKELLDSKIKSIQNAVTVQFPTTEEEENVFVKLIQKKGSR